MMRQIMQAFSLVAGWFNGLRRCAPPYHRVVLWPQERVGKTGAAAIKRQSRKARNRRRQRHAR